MSIRPLIRPSWRLLTSRYSALAKTPPFPTTPTCPAATCSCAPTPAMPAGLPIEYSKPLNGTMPAYAEQVLICTGKDDWVSNIEEEDGGENLAKELRSLTGRAGEFSDPYYPVGIANASFTSSKRPGTKLTSTYLFPSFKYITFRSHPPLHSARALIKSFLLSTELHPAHAPLSSHQRKKILRDEVYKKELEVIQDVEDLTVLICGHGGRDMRCGITGPILRDEFERQLPLQNLQILQGPVQIEEPRIEEPPSDSRGSARIGLISHIGGHKFAGNVILYIPPGKTLADGQRHPLAGCGIWYGRVEPRHVEGIVKETVLEGRVIEELFRGGIRQGGEILRL